MAKPFQMADHRHARILLDTLDQAAPTARHDHVHIAFEPSQHVPDGGAVGGHDQLHRVFRQSLGLQRAAHGGNDRAGRVRAFRPAAQDRRIARAQAKRAGIGGDVRAAFIDDADHAEGHSHPRNIEAVRPLPPGEFLANGVGQAGHGFDAGGNALQPRRIQRQPVQHGRVQPFFPRSLHVLLIRRQDLGCVRANGARHGGQAACAIRRCHLAQLARGGAGAAAHVQHGFGKRGGVCGHRVCHAKGCAGKPGRPQDAETPPMPASPMISAEAGGLTLPEFALE